jgi:hypothetical protein
LSTIKIITTIASWPGALKLHRLSFSKYLKEPFELIAIIDTPKKPGPYNLWDPKLREFAIEFAKTYCDKVVEVPEEIHNNRKSIFPKTKEPSGSNANLRASDSLQIAFNSEILNSNSKVMIVDNDMFPIADLSWDALMKDKVCRSVIHTSTSKFSRKKIDYLWSGLMFIDGEKIPFKNDWSFDCGKVNNIKVDVSGQTHHWLNKLKKEKLDHLFEPISHLSSLKWGGTELNSFFTKSLSDFVFNDERNIDGMFYSELYDKKFIHFRAGSNWNKEPAEIVLSRIDKFTQSFMKHLET